MLKYTPADHVDHEKLSAALSLVESVVEIVNERRRFVENQQKMIAISSQLEFQEVWMDSTKIEKKNRIKKKIFTLQTPASRSSTQLL